MKNNIQRSIISFSIRVTDGLGIYEVPIDQSLAAGLSNLDKIFTIQEAVALGLNLTEITKPDGTQLLSHESDIQIRKTNAMANNELHIDESGQCELPSRETLREHAENPDSIQCISFSDILSEENTVQENSLPTVHANKENVGILPTSMLPTLPSLPADTSENQLITPENSVYIPHVEKKDQYVKIRGSIGINNDNAAKYAEIVKGNYRFYNYKHILYKFDSRLGIYHALTSADLNLIIDKTLGPIIRAKGYPGLYNDISKFLNVDSDLLVPDNCFPSSNLWPFKNGILNVNNKKLYNNDGKLFIRNTLTCEYNPRATCPTFDMYLQGVTNNDPQLINLILEVIGYILSPDNNAKNFFALVGPKDTGKSLFASILAKFFSADALSYLGINDFSGKFDVAELIDKRLNMCMDSPDTPFSPTAAAIIKALTGRDFVRSDVKYKDSISFQNTAKILFCSNTLLRTAVPDPAFTDRLITIPFNYPVPKAEQDKRLEERLTAELSGIANKALSAYIKLKEKNYIFSSVVLSESLNSTFDFKKIVTDFAEQYCDFTDDEKDKIFTIDLYKAFCLFCNLNKLPALETNEFSELFHNLFHDKTQKKRIKINGVSLNGYVKIKLIN